MATSLQLSQAQIAQLNVLRAPATSSVVGTWAPFYQYLAQCIRNSVLPRGSALVTAADVAVLRSGGLLPENQLQSMVWF
jgi:hypothetical protein